MTEGYTKEELKEMMKQMQETHHFYNVLDDLDTVCTDDVRIFLDHDDSYMPDVILHYCRKCDEITGFEAYSTSEQPSTYMLETVINNTPSIMMRKIYACGCKREFITVTMVLERVGFDLEYGYHPIDYAKYLNKEKN